MKIEKNKLLKELNDILQITVSLIADIKKDEYSNGDVEDYTSSLEEAVTTLDELIDET